MTERLQTACEYLVSNKALDDLEEMIERDAFEHWKHLKPGEDENARAKYQGAAELLQTMRNLATS